MKRGPQNENEWKQYSSHNIDKLKNFPMAELFATKHVLDEIYAQGIDAVEKGEIPKQQLEEERLYLDVTKKRLDIVNVAIFGKIESIFEIPDFG